MLDEAHSDTAAHDAVHDAMRRAATLGGNASSLHRAGRAGRDIVEATQRYLLQACGRPHDRALFVGGLAEALLLCIFGLRASAPGASENAATVLLSPQDLDVHPRLPAVLRRLGVASRLWRRGDALPLPRTSSSFVPPAVCYVSLSDEALQSPDAAGAFVADCQRRGIAVHVTLGSAAALQACRGIPFTACSIAAETCGGPPGVVGVVYSENASLTPLWGGGAQFMAARPGTEAIALLAGFAAALRRGAEDPLLRHEVAGREQIHG